MDTYLVIIKYFGVSGMINKKKSEKIPGAIEKPRRFLSESPKTSFIPNT